MVTIDVQRCVRICIRETKLIGITLLYKKFISTNTGITQ